MTPAGRHSVRACLGFASIAALIGSSIGAAAYLAADIRAHGNAYFTIVVLGLPFVAIVAAMFAVPASLLFGAPLLWLLQRPAVRWPLVATVAFALVGVAAGGAIMTWLDRQSVDPERDQWIAQMIGGIVAGLHPVVLLHAAERRWRRTLGVACIGSILAIMLGRLAIDAWQNHVARGGPAELCSAGISVIVMRPDLLPPDLAPPVTPGAMIRIEQGSWQQAEHRPALFNRYAALFVHGQRTMVINDEAFVPVTPWSRLGGERRAQAQCLISNVLPEAAIARRVGLVKPFRFADVDPIWR